MSRYWVLVRGWSREARHWGAFVEQFAAAFPGDRVRALDLPGAGELHAGRSPASIAALAQHCQARAGGSGPVYLLGLSLGAMVCAAWSLAHPRTVAGVVMVNASLRPFSPLHHRLRPRSYGALARAMLEADPRAREERILRLTSTSPEEHPEVVDAWARYAADRPPTRANVARQLWAAASFRAPRVGPESPLLVLAGAGDALVDPRCSQAIARAWNARLAIHPHAGHDLTLDDGPWVAGQVSDWVRPT